jgi:adenylylsulfate kinase
METHKRSIVKAISWRIIALTITTLTVYLFTGDVVLSVGAGLVDSAIKIFAYYGHERMWIRIDFGLKEK